MDSGPGLAMGTAPKGQSQESDLSGDAPSQVTEHLGEIRAPAGYPSAFLVSLLASVTPSPSYFFLLLFILIST